MTVVGVLGAGQLGRMLALAGYPLGLRFAFLDESADAPAGHLGDLTVARFDDGAALDAFADRVDLVTYEFENVPVAAAQRLAPRVPVYPPPRALDVAQDRLKEKTPLQEPGDRDGAVRDRGLSRGSRERGRARSGYPRC